MVTATTYRCILHAKETLKIGFETEINEYVILYLLIGIETHGALCNFVFRAQVFQRLVPGADSADEPKNWGGLP
jgi:hypothetical protein